ncbi:hypothetical protein D8830_04140 [Streptococcus intermedius]|uniref:hypothetical protein n=1 Tax=Streptococcus intermedius TaxID=1338 RepID=UPI000F6746E5|nr:hypothetical protein [Streptococcus intermedius]RSJ18350.1 hypothetical protein D8830_04140 [Streptococcus intermedius]
MNIAKEEYTSYVVGQKLTINEGTVTIGTVVDVIDQSDNGLYMTVIKEPDICITLQDKQFCLFYSVI